MEMKMNKETILITEEQVIEYVNVMASGDMSFVVSVLADIASGTYTPEQLKGDILGINQE
jgi:hypothetical protein